MNKLFRIVSVLLAAVILVSVTSSCSKEELPTEDEIISASKTLLENAVEVNRIFFWEGLPHVEVTEDKIDLGDAEYIVLTEDYMYLSQNDLMEKARSVYSESYCKDIESVSFEGVKIDDDNALFARYIEEQGVMKINRRLSESGLSERLPDTDTIQIVELSGKRAVVNLSFSCDGITEKQNVTLVKEADGWRLDTPTY